jgi:hypothetical protein
MVLAATAIPIELRPLGRAPLDWGIGISDFVENILGFVPVGMVLAELGLLRVVLLVAAMSVFAETSQLWIDAPHVSTCRCRGERHRRSSRRPRLCSLSDSLAGVAHQQNDKSGCGGTGNLARRWDIDYIGRPS